MDMKSLYKVIRIDEDIFYGCEERADDMPVMVVVTMEAPDGTEMVARIEDQILWDRNIQEGDLVQFDGNKFIEKVG